MSRASLLSYPHRNGEILEELVHENIYRSKHHLPEISTYGYKYSHLGSYICVFFFILDIVVWFTINLETCNTSVQMFDYVSVVYQIQLCGLINLEMYNTSVQMFDYVSVVTYETFLERYEILSWPFVYILTNLVCILVVIYFFYKL